jgi:TonB family protein
MKPLLWVCMVIMMDGSAFAQQQISGQAPGAIEAVVPGYPRLPSGGREDGEVRVEITVNTEGSVTAAKALSGPDLLRTFAESVALKWKFEKQDQVITTELVFAFVKRLGLGDPPKVTAIFKPPNRMEVFAEAREVVTIADPQMVDVEKEKKKKKEPKVRK